MTAIFGYFLCLLAIMPAYSMDAFFRLIGKSTRQHDILDLFRFTVQTLANVTSPFKIGLMLAVATSVFLAGGVRPARIAALLVVGLAGLLGSAQMFLLGRSAGMGAAILLVPSTISTFASFWWASRHALINAPF